LPNYAGQTPLLVGARPSAKGSYLLGQSHRALGRASLTASTLRLQTFRQKLIYVERRYLLAIAAFAAACSIHWSRFSAPFCAT